MKRSVELLGGGVLGLVLGTVFLAHPIASVLTTYARATWSLAGCPPGVYVLTSTAQLVSGGPIYNASTPVHVPQSDVVQVFNDVSPGQYSVTGILRRTNGATVASAVQTVATNDGVGFLARSRAPEQEAKGKAGPRLPQPPPASGITVPSLPAVPSPTIWRACARQVPASASAGPREWLLAELIQLSDPSGTEHGWHQIQLVDLDGDGLADEVRIEPPDAPVVVWRLVYQRPPVEER